MLTVAMVLLPETPYWLIEYNQFEKAKKSLRFFRGSKYDVNPEFNEIHQRHLSKDKNQSCSWMLQRLFSKAFMKPFMCSGVIYMIFTGKSLSEAFILPSTNPHYDKTLFIDLPVQYMKTTTSEHVVYTNCFLFFF